MTKKLFVLSALLLAAAPALAGPPAGSTALGTGVAATPWVRTQAPEKRPYALTGQHDDAKRTHAGTRSVVRIGNKVEIDQYR